jgi:SAM-dependent methyltransferase
MTSDDAGELCYDEALARHYDEDYAILRSASADVVFYRELGRAAPGPVLEVACGTGRVLLPLARAGLEVTGVDASSAMLALLEAKLPAEVPAVRERVRLAHGRFDATSVEGSFGLIYSAFRAFQHLYTDDQKRAGLVEMARLLAPDGTLAFDLFDYSPARAAQRAEEQTDYCLEDGDELRERRSRALVAADGRLIHGCFRWLVNGETVDQADFQMAITRREEIEPLLASAGLRLHALYADFEGAAWCPDDPREMIVLARHTDAD